MNRLIYAKNNNLIYEAWSNVLQRVCIWFVACFKQPI
jgi:hypothetical protein